LAFSSIELRFVEKNEKLGRILGRDNEVEEKMKVL
jgi:hypothetical protein